MIARFERQVRPAYQQIAQGECHLFRDPVCEVGSRVGESLDEYARQLGILTLEPGDFVFSLTPGKLD